MPSNIKITVLGSGTSAGIPMIGCDCNVCRSPDPRDKRTRTSAAVSWTDDRGNDRVVLIDAGPDLRQQAIRHGLTRCDAVLVTHTHTDHVFGIDELRRFNAVMSRNNTIQPIPIYAEHRAWPSLSRIYTHIFEREKNAQPSFVATLAKCPVNGFEHEELPDRRPTAGGAGEPITLFGLTFTPIRVFHGKLPVIAWRIEREHPSKPHPDALLPAAWVTDVSAVPPDSWNELTDLNTLFLDGLRHRKHPTHFTLGQATSVAAELQPARTFLIHIAHEILHDRDEPTLPDGVRLAVDGLTLAEAPDGGILGWWQPDHTQPRGYEWPDRAIQPANDPADIGADRGGVLHGQHLAIPPQHPA